MAKRKIDKSLLQSFKNRDSGIKQAKQNQKEQEKQAKIKQKEEEERKRKEEEERLKKEEENRLKDKLNILTTHKIKITTLSPIHIGNGEMLEPISFIIKDDYLYLIDDEFLFSKFITDGEIKNYKLFDDIASIVEFLKGKRDYIIQNQLYISKIPVASDIVKLYEKEYGKSNNNDNSFNQILIQQHISTINPYNNRFEPYIPGSSIKGALQTVLNLSESESRALKISDSIGLDVKNRIAWSVRKAKKTDNDRKSKKSDIPQKLEVIEKNSIFETEISKKDKLTFEEIKDRLHSFYKKADSKLYMRYSFEIKQDNQFLLRVGRYVGREFMSNNNLLEKPKTKSIFKNKEKDNKSEEPFGWLLCEIIS